MNNNELLCWRESLPWFSLSCHRTKQTESVCFTFGRV